MLKNLFFLLLNGYNYSNNEVYSNKIYIIVNQEDPILKEEKKRQLEFVKNIEDKYLKVQSTLIGALILGKIIFEENKEGLSLFFPCLLVDIIWKYVFHIPFFSYDFEILKFFFIDSARRFLWVMVYMIIAIIRDPKAFSEKTIEEGEEEKKTDLTTKIFLGWMMTNVLISMYSPFILKPLYKKYNKKSFNNKSIQDKNLHM